jgi:hypothetical protein
VTLLLQVFRFQQSFASTRYFGRFSGAFSGRNAGSISSQLISSKLVEPLPHPRFFVGVHVFVTEKSCRFRG